MGYHQGPAHTSNQPTSRLEKTTVECIFSPSQYSMALNLDIALRYPFPGDPESFPRKAKNPAFCLHRIHALALFGWDSLIRFRMTITGRDYLHRTRTASRTTPIPLLQSRLSQINYHSIADHSPQNFPFSPSCETHPSHPHKIDPYSNKNPKQ